MTEFARFDRSPDVRIAALRELSRWWGGAPETIDALRHLAATDENKEVRLAACTALWKNYSETPEIANLLVGRLNWETGEKNPLVDCPSDTYSIVGTSI